MPAAHEDVIGGLIKATTPPAHPRDSLLCRRQKARLGSIRHDVDGPPPSYCAPTMISGGRAGDVGGDRKLEFGREEIEAAGPRIGRTPRSRRKPNGRRDYA